MSEMHPRFVIRDKEDAANILRGLGTYCDLLTTRIVHGDGGAIEELAIVSDLLREIFNSELERGEKELDSVIETEVAKAHDDDEIRREFFNN